MPGSPDLALASMGIYIFNGDVLVQALEEDAATRQPARFRQEHHPVADSAPAPVFAYRFYDENKKAAKCWRDIGTLDAYFEASMDLCQVNPEFNLYDPEVAAAHVSAAGAAGEVRVCREGRGAAGARFADLAGVHRLGQPSFSAAFSVRTSACTASAESSSRS